MTAKAIGLNPKIYLRDVFLHIANESEVVKLTPHGWSEHFAEQVAAEKQGFTQFRRAVSVRSSSTNAVRHKIYGTQQAPNSLPQRLYLRNHLVLVRVLRRPQCQWKRFL